MFFFHFFLFFFIFWTKTTTTKTTEKYKKKLKNKQQPDSSKLIMIINAKHAHTHTHTKWERDRNRMWKKTMWCNVFQCVWDFFVCHTHTHTFQSILIFFFLYAANFIEPSDLMLSFWFTLVCIFFFFWNWKNCYLSPSWKWTNRLTDRERVRTGKKKCQLIRCNDTINFHSFFFLSLPFIELILLFHCQLPDFRMMMMMMMIVVIFYTLVSGQFKITTTNDARIHNDNNNNNNNDNDIIFEMDKKFIILWQIFFLSFCLVSFSSMIIGFRFG